MLFTALAVTLKQLEGKKGLVSGILVLDKTLNTIDSSLYFRWTFGSLTMVQYLLTVLLVLDVILKQIRNLDSLSSLGFGTASTCADL